MTYKTHMIGGIALAAIIHLNYLSMTELEMVGYYSIALGSAILPDIDHKKSFISQHTLGLHHLFKRFTHRGATHSIVAVVLIQVILISLWGMNPLTLAFGIGYASHLLLDSLNPRGIPVLYPFSKKKYRLARLTTGEKGEYMVAGMLMMVVAYCGYQLIMTVF